MNRAETLELLRVSVDELRGAQAIVRRMGDFDLEDEALLERVRALIQDVGFGLAAYGG